MVEVVIAATVMLTGLLALAYTAAVAFPDIALARQRQSANGLANEAIEEAKALSFDTLSKGLAAWDLSGDPRLTVCGSATCYGGETVPTSGYPAGTSIVPLVPHSRPVVVGPTTYAVSVYVSHYLNDTSTETFSLTAVVSWPNPARQGARAEVQTQTIVFSPEGCLSTATHPFAAPCQPFLYATASAGDSSIQITGFVEGLDLEAATLRLPTFTSALQVEQISAVQGTAQTSSVLLKEIGAAEESRGRNQVSSGADNDPSQPDSDFQTRSAAAQAAGTLSMTGVDHRVSVTVSESDMAVTTSTTSASITPSHPCPDLSGVNENDGQPCGNSSARQANALSATLELDHGSTLFGSAVLAQMGGAPDAGAGVTNRALLPESPTCAGAVGDGCVRAEAHRSMGALSLAGLPGDLDPASLPSGWAGSLIYLTGFSDDVSAEGGWGSAAPAVSTSGTIQYWNGTGYTELVVAPGAAVDIPVADMVVEDSSEGPTVVVSITASLTTGVTQLSETIETCDPACPTTRTSASASSGTPIFGTITYQVWRDGILLADLTIQVNLGQLVVQTTYQKSPSGA